jgi:hypothetical protein
MYRKIWKECHASVCSISFLSKAGTRITSLTGFRIRDYIITSEIITRFNRPEKVYLKFVREDGFTKRADKMLTYNAFKERIYRLGEKEYPGYVIIRLDDKEFKDIPSLKCCRKINYDIGQSIAILGHSNEHDNLAIKAGIISSSCVLHSGMNHIQVVSTLQYGNAGSPLIETENYEVIGVMGSRLTAIARTYQTAMSIFNQNIALLNKVVGKYSFDDVDPIQALLANQNQIKVLLKEYFKTAETKLGCAVELCNLIDYCPDLESTNDFEMKAIE